MDAGTITVFTIGHSNHPIERFLELLAQHEIAVLADIRRFPGSRKHPQFNRESVETTLRGAGLEYRWFEALGGRRKSAGASSGNNGLRNASFRNYADYMQTPEFTQAVDELLVIAAKCRTALMCAEGLWWQCHRRLVSDYLSARGEQVEHILPNGQKTLHAMTPEARVERGYVIYPPAPGLFDGDGTGG